MVDRGPLDLLREVEEGRHGAGIGPVTSGPGTKEEGKCGKSQDYENTSAVRPGSQATSSAPSVTRMSKSGSWSSHADQNQQSGPPYRTSNSRPPSCATEDEPSIAEKMRLPDTVKRAQTGLQQHVDSKPLLFEKVKRTLCIPFPRKEIKMKEDKDGAVELDAGNPGSWVVDHHLPGLVVEIVPYVPPRAQSFQQRTISQVKTMVGKPLQGPRRDEDGKSERTFRVSFAEMQRMHLRKLQVNLVNHAVTMYSTTEETQNWEKDLAAYSEHNIPSDPTILQALIDLDLVQAMKDYDYMMECSGRARDPFLATGERNIDHYVTQRVIKDVLDKYYCELDKPSEENPLGPWEDDGEPIGGTRKRTRKALSFKDFRDRLFLATVGAALLLGPMWLMVLHNTLYTGLVTTTVCVGVFGLVVVFWLDKLMDVLSATAAYAAVLVVFVGLTTDSS